MVKKVTKWFFSIKSALVLMLLFALSIGVATFIENDYGTQTARALIYNARWFEVLLLLLSLNLAYNIVKFRLFRREKFFTGLFHAAFLLIVIGAALTRYVGYEGLMHIREGGRSSTIVSDRTYLQLEAQKGKRFYRYEEPIYLTRLGSNSWSRTIDFDGERIEVELEAYLPSVTRQILPDPQGKGILELVLSHGGGRIERILEEGDSINLGGVAIGFEDPKAGIQITKQGGQLLLRAPMGVERLTMGTMERRSYRPESSIPLESGHLYTFANGLNLVLKSYHPRAKVHFQPHPMAKKSPNPDLLILRLKRGQEEQMVHLFGKSGQVGQPVSVELGDLRLYLAYGAKEIRLPFALELKDFQLERYPGSMSPSSYASEVRVIDGNRSFDYRIYMNHVLDYKGYRFFQSSYDPDEKGTILSVNHDPGTLITYIGYFLLALGMVLHFFMPQSRFQKLLRLTKKVQEQRKALAGTLALLLPLLVHGGEDLDLAAKISKEHADRFGSVLLVQDHDGRIEPLDTLSRQVLAKLARKEELYNLDANQILLGMLVFPTTFQEIPLIHVHHPALKELIGLPQDQKLASYNQFFDENGSYKLAQLVDKALRKRPAQRNQLDKELIKVNERVNVSYLVYSGSLLRIIPDPHDKGGRWLSPIDAIQHFPPKERELIRLIMASYFTSVEHGVQKGDWSKANKSLDVIRDYQKYYGSALIPSKRRIEAELLYNKLDIFNRLVPYYTIIGGILLLLILIHLIHPRFQIKWAVNIGVFLIFLGFLAHTFAMGLRWYVAGHAPWSNGYESMVYIAWASVLAGFFFVRRAPIAFAATSLLGGLILFVAHLNWMDPQITNLVPVLKSYWLMIHVSVITASYGFLGLSALLAFIVLLLFIFLTPKNRPFLELTFKELTYINEMSLIIGLVLVTIGNFLGGVWANESWGRYWGWDPKETWAAVTILVYAVVEHMRLVPGLNKLFIYNVAALLAYASVIMTYFGVNFYLSGMHSYASGDPVPIPTWVYWAIGILFLLIALAYYKKRKLGVEIRI
ncbi:MAG: cytochrome C biogenesis protein [Nitratiruptor sp.]|nr:cytochrome C biogenesis protein [Nitratiruptor sp.]NPA83974.1 cytochrome c biogenesis protein CcsA [Campylobacterota bacterium]